MAPEADIASHCANVQTNRKTLTNLSRTTTRAYTRIINTGLTTTGRAGGQLYLLTL